MDWLTQMNEALDYIESHLTDEIDLDEIGRITACPAGLFQRIFPKIIGIPLSEYIRGSKREWRQFKSISTSDLYTTCKRSNGNELSY